MIFHPCAVRPCRTDFYFFWCVGSQPGCNQPYQISRWLRRGL